MLQVATVALQTKRDPKRQRWPLHTSKRKNSVGRSNNSKYSCMKYWCTQPYKANKYELEGVNRHNYNHSEGLQYPTLIIRQATLKKSVKPHDQIDELNKYLQTALSNNRIYIFLISTWKLFQNRSYLNS